jgi:hypothetical protein
MSDTYKSQNTGKDPDATVASNQTPAPPASRKRREWPLVMCVLAVTLTLLLLLLYAASWLFAEWFG